MRYLIAKVLKDNFFYFRKKVPVYIGNENEYGICVIVSFFLSISSRKCELKVLSILISYVRTTQEKLPNYRAVNAIKTEET